MKTWKIGLLIAATIVAGAGLRETYAAEAALPGQDAYPQKRRDVRPRAEWPEPAGEDGFLDPGTLEGQKVADLTTAHLLRRMLGFDVVSLGALDVPQATYERLSVEAITFVRDNRAVVDAGLAQWLTALAASGHRDVLDDPGIAVADLRTAHAAVRTNAAQLIVEFQTELSGASIDVPAQLAANAGLDPLLRLLDLDEAQRADLLLAALERNAVLLNPYRRARPAQVRAASERYEETIWSVLSVDQYDQLASYRALASDNLDVFSEIDEDAWLLASLGANARFINDGLGPLRAHGERLGTIAHAVIGSLLRGSPDLSSIFRRSLRGSPTASAPTRGNVALARSKARRDIPH